MTWSIIFFYFFPFSAASHHLAIPMDLVPPSSSRISFPYSSTKPPSITRLGIIFVCILLTYPHHFINCTLITSIIFGSSYNSISSWFVLLSRPSLTFPPNFFSIFFCFMQLSYFPSGYLIYMCCWAKYGFIYIDFRSS